MLIEFFTLSNNFSDAFDGWTYKGKSPQKRIKEPVHLVHFLFSQNYER
jgi:hypothetical protein